MRKIIIITSMLFFAPQFTAAQGQQYISDAFGMAPVQQITGTPRNLWSGMREYIEPDGTVEQVTVPPFEPDILFAFVGPKSAIAGNDYVHAIAIGVDRIGNLIDDTHQSFFKLGNGETATSTVRHGITDHYFLPETFAEVFLTGIQIADRQTARAEYRVIPDLSTVEFTLQEPEDAYKPETFARLQSIAMIDQYDNSSGDGVAVQFIVHHDDGSASIATNVTVSNAATGRFLAREMHAAGTVTANIATRKSESAAFNILPMEVPFEPKIVAENLAAIKAIKLRIGPFLTDAGYLLNDGTPVQVQFNPLNAPSYQVEAWLANGLLEVIVPGTRQNLPATVEVSSVAGNSVLPLKAFNDFDFFKNWSVR